MTTTETPGKPDIQYFAESGPWIKPLGAVRADIVLQGGGGGAAVRGQAAIQPGKDGRITVQSIPADELPDAMTVTIGRGGRPGGRDGYALIVTHLDGDPGTSVIVTDGIWLQGGTCATCGNPVPGGGHQDGCTGLVPGSEYRIDSRDNGEQSS